MMRLAHVDRLLIAIFGIVFIATAVFTTDSSAQNSDNAAQKSDAKQADPKSSDANSSATKPDSQAELKKLGNRGAMVHDPSTIVKCNGEYWVFYTGRNTPSWHSKDLITWLRGPAANATPPAWIRQAVPANNGNSFWAPDVIKVGDKYLLFFAVSTFGKNTSAIGVATNPTLDPADPKFKWTDGGIVVQSKATDNFNAIDPAAFLDDDGKLWLSFGSFWSGIKLIELDPATGLRISPDSPMTALAHNNQIEAAYIYKHAGKYYLFVNYGRCCQGMRSTYYIVVGRSDKVTGPYLDKDGKDLMSAAAKDSTGGGGTLVAEKQGDFIGPGHAGILNADGKSWFSCHFYDGTTPRGTSKLSIRPLTWSDDGWPVVGVLEEK
jgi:arabinan endo-1,5-alpha-L-arabinosidase